MPPEGAKRNVYLFEINDVLTNQIKIPYSTGLIWSWCIENKEIVDNYKLDGWFWYRDEEFTIESVLKQIENPSVIGFNCFVWNWNWNIKIAEKIKAEWPECLIVFGGWQQPMADRTSGFFNQHPYVDILVHGEGEITFAEILKENLKKNPKWETVEGCTIPYRLVTDSKAKNKLIKDGLKVVEEYTASDSSNIDPLSVFATPPRQRIQDLASMPSPYLNGLFDELIKGCEYELEGTIESTRGCPYQCTFCEIGTKYYQKIKSPTLEKVFKEIDWLSKNKVLFVYNADSNFGMLPDHLEITKYLIAKKKETGFPDKHRCDWAKNKGDKVLELAKLFYDSKMDKGITIALQSLNPETLKAVRRKNVDNGKLSEFLQLYNEEDLPSYVELILGLPEETKESFIDGICQILDLGQHNYIGIYPLTALPNTPFGHPDYIEEYGLKIVATYPAFQHVDISDQNDFEREHMVVGSNTMTHKEYKEATVWRWFFMFAHYLGNLQYISRFVNTHLKVSYKDFYTKLFEHIQELPLGSFLRKELEMTKVNIEKVMNATGPWGRSLDHVRPNFAWDFEEATAIEIARNRRKFTQEIASYLQSNFDMSDDLTASLLKYQHLGVLDPHLSYPVQETFEYNIHDVIFENADLKKVKTCLEFQAKNYDGNLFEWGKETLWWGRRVAACKTKINKLKGSSK